MAKYILEKIRLEGVLQDIIANSTGENVKVTYNGTEQTLAAALASIYSSITNLPTADGVDTKISAAISDLIGGAPETYDTLKEIADYIEAHKEVSDALNAAVGNKVDKVEGKGLSTEDFTTALKTKLENMAPVTAADVTNWNNKVDKVTGKQLSTEDFTTALKDKLEGTQSVSAAEKAAWSAKAETTVATASADGLMSSTDKARLDGIRGVRYGAEAPADMKDGELFVKVVS